MTKSGNRITEKKILPITVNNDVLDALPAYYKNSFIPQHLKQILMEEIMTTVTKSANIYFINKNKVDEDKYYSKNQNERKGYHSDVASVSDGYPDDQVSFLPLYSLTSRDIFIYLYHMGMFSFFDFGYQVNTIDQEYINTTRRGFYDRLKSVNPDSTILKYDNVLRLNETPGSVWQMNHCPLCKLFKKDWVSHNINDIIEKQHNHYICNDKRATICSHKMYNNHGIYQHMFEKGKRCSLHWLLLKWLEELYPDITWRYQSKPQHRHKKCKKFEFEINCVTHLPYHISTYVLTR